MSRVAIRVGSRRPRRPPRRPPAGARPGPARRRRPPPGGLSRQRACARLLPKRRCAGRSAGEIKEDVIHVVAVLAGDLHRIPEAPRRDQGRAVALALQQGVGHQGRPVDYRLQRGQGVPGRCPLGRSTVAAPSLVRATFSRAPSSQLALCQRQHFGQPARTPTEGRPGWSGSSHPEGPATVVHHQDVGKRPANVYTGP